MYKDVPKQGIDLCLLLFCSKKKTKTKCLVSQKSACERKLKALFYPTCVADCSHHANCFVYFVCTWQSQPEQKSRRRPSSGVSWSQEWWHWCLHSNGAFLSGRALAGPWHWISNHGLHPSTQRLSSSLSFSSTWAALWSALWSALSSLWWSLISAP